MTYPNIALHFGHRIPIYISMLPTRNKDSAPYNNVLNNAIGIYFSVNANMAIAEKLTATIVKYIFFCLFIMFLGIIMPYLFSSMLSHMTYCPYGDSFRLNFINNPISLTKYFFHIILPDFWHNTTFFRKFFYTIPCLKISLITARAASGFSFAIYLLFSISALCV